MSMITALKGPPGSATRSELQWLVVCTTDNVVHEHAAHHHHDADEHQTPLAWERSSLPQGLMISLIASRHGDTHKRHVRCCFKLAEHQVVVPKSDRLWPLLRYL